MSLQQIKTDLEVQTWNLCCVDIWLVVISIDFLLLVLNTRVVSMSHIPIELISFSRFLMHVSFPFNVQLDTVESSAYYIQLLFCTMIDMSAMQRMNNMGASIGSLIKIVVLLCFYKIILQRTSS